MIMIVSLNIQPLSRLCLECFAPVPQRPVLDVGEPDGRLGQPPLLGDLMVNVVDKVHVAFQASEVAFSTDLAMNLCLGGRT